MPSPIWNAHSPRLRRIVPALEGLKSDKGQLQLQSILKRTGEVIQAQVPKMPDLIARESVAQVDVTGAKSPETGALSQTSRGFPQVTGLLQQYSLQFATDEKQLEQNLHLTLVTETPWRDFDYLILARRSSNGAQVLEESRTDLKAPNGKRLKREQKILHGIGFEYLWLLFLPGNTPQSNYRLGGKRCTDTRPMSSDLLNRRLAFSCQVRLISLDTLIRSSIRVSRGLMKLRSALFA